jgi:oligoendopeptidase F
MSSIPVVISRPKRHFLPEDFHVTEWPGVKPYFDALLSRALTSAEELRRWLRDRSELESALAEDLGWRYVRMTCYTDNEEYSRAYQDFIQNIQPRMAPLGDQLNRKLAECPFLSVLSSTEGFDILIRNVRKEIEIFREENVPLFTEVNTLTQKYAQISGAMTVTEEGKELTLQQAAVFLQHPDRARRERVYRAIGKRRLQDAPSLGDLFDQLVRLRHRIARQAGFVTFRDYMFKALGRFDYTPEDCFAFHDSIEKEVLPLVNELARDRKEVMGVERLRPWDKAVDPEGREALKPFSNGENLLERTERCFTNVDPYLGNCLATLRVMKHLDLESRKGKAPGGYNYPMAEVGVPFIFMNATSTVRDMVTLLHEGGHAVHNFLTREMELAEFKSPPMEVAELASMSMELITMDQWTNYFDNPGDLRRAKREHLEDLIEVLPWVATVDKFQHWLYENPEHTQAQRREAWVEVFDRFADTVTEWEGMEDEKAFLWQKQLHLYEVPFYYIEYGMAQLGAIAVWKNYKENAGRGLEGYKKALSLGNLRTIPEIYSAAGIRFDFSRAYIRSLMDFVKKQLDGLA